MNSSLASEYEAIQIQLIYNIELRMERKEEFNLLFHDFLRKN